MLYPMNEIESTVSCEKLLDHDCEDPPDEMDYEVPIRWWSSSPSSATLKLCEQIENNEVNSIYVSPQVHATSDIKLLANALRRNSSVESFYFKQNDPMPEYPKDFGSVLWKAISRHGNKLKEISIVAHSLSSCSDGYRLPAMMEFLECFDKLEVLSDLSMGYGFLMDMSLETRTKLLGSLTVEKFCLHGGREYDWKYNWTGTDLSGCFPKYTRALTLMNLTGIGKQGAHHLCQVLPGVEELSFALDYPNHSQWLKDAGQVVVQFLINADSLCLRSLDWVQADDGTAKALGQLLKKHPNGSTLQRLTMCGLSSTGMIFVADAISTNSTLEILHLNQNDFSITSQATLNTMARAIQKNKTLRELHLVGHGSFKGYYQVDFAELARALETNKSLGSICRQGLRTLLERHVSTWKNQDEHDAAKLLDQCDYIEFLLLCNRNRDHEMKHSYIQEQTQKMAGSQSPCGAPTTQSSRNSSTTTSCDARVCDKCSVSTSNILQCSNLSHGICRTCAESILEAKLGECHIGCPVDGCVSEQWNVDTHFYGFVSQFHYKMHVKEALQATWLDVMKQQRLEKLE